MKVQLWGLFGLVQFQFLKLKMNLKYKVIYSTLTLFI